MTDTEREQRIRNLVELVVDPVRRYLHRRTDAGAPDDRAGSGAEKR